LNLDITYSDGCSVKRPRLHPAAPEQIKNRPPSDIADYLLPCVAARPRALPSTTEPTGAVARRYRDGPIKRRRTHRKTETPAWRLRCCIYRRR